jgi:putative acetyltransferase
MEGLVNVKYRKILSADNPAVAQIIKTVMPEFGANAPGFAIHDEEVGNMFDAYSQYGSAYFVCEVNERIVGGAGIAPLQDGPAEICELKKMYFLQEERRKGFGKLLLHLCLREARALNYSKCYIETYHTMTAAMSLYEAVGFRQIAGSLGNTGHFACDRFYVLEL